MKIKYLLGSLLMALLGASIALFAYSKIQGKSEAAIIRDSSKVEVRDAQPFLTSLQMQEGQVDFKYAAEKTVHGVVHVHTKAMTGGQADNPVMEWFYGDRYNKQREVNGYGSGVIISDDGYIITNNHVIADAESVEVTLNDKRTFTAKIIGRDPGSDIALLKISASNLSVIKYGDSDQLKLGEWVLAVGNPFNLTSTVTAGIVSAKGRNLGLNEGDYRIESFIQTDAALNMGNSGGALVDTKGMLVGITSAIISPNGGYAGNSFAIPVSIVKKVVDDLKEFGEVQRALIGVEIKDVDSEIADKQKLGEVKGVLITRIVPDGSAEAAGLKVDDVIVGFDGQDVGSVAELQEKVGRHRPGDKGSVSYLRNGKESSVQVVLKNKIGNTSVVTAESGSEEVSGARLATLGSSDMRNLKVENGVKIMELNDGRFKDMGMKRGYVILNINGKKVKSPSDVRLYSDNGRSIRSIGGIQSDGTIFSYQFGN
jgi:Do/DeqQ family serine protease